MNKNPALIEMNQQPPNHTRQNFDGKECIYFDGYWIRYYKTHADTLATRKKLIDNLTRRAFHHTESGINTPGERLEEAREAFEKETDPAKKRVNGAMLAGALFNRATDIFTAIVELEGKGVKVSHDNELMRQCSCCFRQALELGKQVKHYSGQEGIDELWGEPFKAFSQPIAQLYESRYRKIAQTMREIDTVTSRLTKVFKNERAFAGLLPKLKELSSSAKLQIETIKNDPAFFTVWPAFIAAREAVDDFEPARDDDQETAKSRHLDEGVKLIKAGSSLITYLSEARVPMPKSTTNFMQQCDAFEEGR